MFFFSRACTDLRDLFMTFYHNLFYQLFKILQEDRLCNLINIYILMTMMYILSYKFNVLSL
jgi:hypothetical protein